MSIQILAEAEHDLIYGYRFYESRLGGLGEYFLNTLFSDIDSLKLYAGIHPIQYDAFVKSRFFSFFRHPGRVKRDPGSSDFKHFWTPAFAGVTGFGTFYEAINMVFIDYYQEDFHMRSITVQMRI